ncbi:response regulator receiver sensor signal transduction histidine kinase [Thalassoporum mexicanum PCC 7367]|uniref:hybrid sensor histidine kinase/response regulator n=1 Tax=Thalassoporum mexicanum TaxID=3457544 RepID=UPI00029FF953|nr:response regulator [Pseudanabaena sp. PCC 7367]AFY69760.1 response regulator receiver sensor signal transduction histidine kinase [Pseudanabaena sp. PCC 7367]
MPDTPVSDGQAQVTSQIATQTILIVDDHRINCDILKRTLSRCGLQTLVAMDGESGIQLAIERSPDLILLDVSMPGIDGFETCERLKQAPQTAEIPVIFMTGLSDTEDKVRGFNVGAVDYVTKPFEQEEVIARIKSQLKIGALTKELLDLNQSLEEKVIKRTEQLSQALDNLKQTQISLVQKEKMYALGELMGGLAHEISNPLSVIAGNVDYLSKYGNDLLGLLRLYEKHLPDNVPEIEQYNQQIEIDYLRKDFFAIVAAMERGAGSIAQLIRSLKHYLRRDDAAMQLMNIHEVLESTLMILRHRLKACPTHRTIQIMREYKKLPPVSCYPAPISQVFMSLVSNAIDSIDASEEMFRQEYGIGSDYEMPLIRIGTQWIDEKIRITIADNGAGLTAESQQRLAEPLFTNKPISNEPELSLVISRHIIEEKHHGWLEFSSEPGRGLEFVIEIPLT